MKNKTYQRKFGQYHVTVEETRIAIVGDWNSNFGQFYPHNFERFKAHPKGKEHDFNRPQIIGMEWEFGLTQSVKNWLISLVLKDKISK